MNITGHFATKRACQAHEKILSFFAKIQMRKSNANDEHSQ